MEDKTVHYQSDGTGRDKYVLQFGGGLWKQERKDITIKSGKYMQFKNNQQSKPTYNDKVAHYHACGTGRDYCIVVNSGGIINNYSCNEARTNFLKTLRNYDNEKHVGQQKMMPNQQQVFKRQQQMSDYLSRPKSVQVPFQKQLESETEKYLSKKG